MSLITVACIVNLNKMLLILVFLLCIVSIDAGDYYSQMKYTGTFIYKRCLHLARPMFLGSRFIGATNTQRDVWRLVH